MGTIAVSVDGDPIFNWQGDEAAITQLMEAFPSAAERVGLTPNKFAQACVSHLSSDILHKQGAVGQKMQMMGVVWLILDQNTNNAEHPGKIRDYAAITDFEVDLRPHDGGVTFQVNAMSKFDS
jgi:hypothetical protein